MKNMKKSIIGFGVILAATLLVSTGTAVEQANSETIINYIKGEEQANLISQIEELGSPAYFEPMCQDYTVADFINFLLSDEFIDFMKSQEITDFLSSDMFLEIYNSDEAQEFIQSVEFRDFRVSTVALTFLEKYRQKVEKTVLEPMNVEIQCTSSQVQTINSVDVVNSYIQPSTQANTNEEISSLMTTNFLCDEIEESMSLTVQNIEHIAAPGDIEGVLLLFAYLLIGIITWPIAYVIFGAYAPEIGILLGFYCALYLDTTNPIEFIVVGVSCAFIIKVFCTRVAIFWPAIWYFILDWWFNG